MLILRLEPFWSWYYRSLAGQVRCASNLPSFSERQPAAVTEPSRRTAIPLALIQTFQQWVFYSNSPKKTFTQLLQRLSRMQDRPNYWASWTPYWFFVPRSFSPSDSTLVLAWHKRKQPTVLGGTYDVYECIHKLICMVSARVVNSRNMLQVISLSNLHNHAKE